jgi:maltose/moltooligosaccharide transporter
MTDEFTQVEGKWHDANGVRVWRAGTLVYYRKDLIRLFFWLYVGQFTFWMEAIAIPTMFPLLLAGMGYNAAQIGSLWSIFPLGALVLFPIIGTISDRTRTRFGRRRPFDLVTTPIWFAGLVMLPFAQNYWQALGCMILIGFAGAASNILIAFYNDVVPPELMGRFVGGMRFLGSIGALVVHLFALRIFETHPVAVFIGFACIGFAGEMIMLLKVKEGKYPAPPPKTAILNVVGEFLREGFANRYIIFLWLTLGVTALGGPVMGLYFNLFFTDAESGLGLTATQLGYVLAIGTGIGLVLLLPAGWSIDRFGPKKLWAYGGFIVGVVQILMFFMARDLISVSILYAIFAAINTVLTAALIPVMYCFMPQEKFGQLNGSNQIVGRILQIVGANACSFIIVLAQGDYRYAFIFGGVAYMLTPVFLWLMLRQPWPYGNLTTSMNPNGSAALNPDLPKQPAPQPAE